MFGLDLHPIAHFSLYRFLLFGFQITVGWLLIPSARRAYTRLRCRCQILFLIFLLIVTIQSYRFPPREILNHEFWHFLTPLSIAIYEEGVVGKVHLKQKEFDFLFIFIFMVQLFYAHCTPFPAHGFRVDEHQKPGNHHYYRSLRLDPMGLPQWDIQWRTWKVPTLFTPL